MHGREDTPITGVLFDLDGTLVDTAPDLVFSLNHSLTHAGFSPVGDHIVRQHITRGSLAMVNAAISSQAHTTQQAVQQAMLHHYAVTAGERAQLYPGITGLLSQLDDRHIPYGVVTNKHARFTRPLLNSLGLTSSMACIVSGDSTKYAKPHTAPMLLAAQQLQQSPAHIAYLGDAERDIIAARNSNMLSIAALWGYLNHQDEPANWLADFNCGSAADAATIILHSSNIK